MRFSGFDFGKGNDPTRSGLTWVPISSELSHRWVFFERFLPGVNVSYSKTRRSPQASPQVAFHYIWTIEREEERSTN